jgi:hypothetical protein
MVKLGLIHRVFQEERPLLWEVIVSVILSKRSVHVWVHVSYTKWFPRYSYFMLSPTQTNTKMHSWWTTRHILICVVKCIDVDGILEHVLY